MSDQFFWFATRSAGILAWFAACASVLAGLLMSTRALGRRPTIPWLLDLHRYLGAMSIVFLAIHMLTLWADSFVQFGWAELLVPGVADVGGLPRWSLALGVIAAWFLIAVEASSLIKDRLDPRTWHTIHLYSFGVVVAGAVHGVVAGSDTDNRYLVAAAASVLMAMTLLVVMRVFAVLTDRKRRYEAALADEAAPVDDDRARDHGDRDDDRAWDHDRYDDPDDRPEWDEDWDDEESEWDEDDLIPLTRSTRLVEPPDRGGRPEPGRWFADPPER